MGQGPGYRIIAEDVDAGVSGATDAVDRPGLFDALEQIGRPSHADGIIAARLDRLARALTVRGHLGVVLAGRSRIVLPELDAIGDAVQAQITVKVL